MNTSENTSDPVKAFSELEPGEWFIQRAVMGWMSRSTDQAVSSHCWCSLLLFSVSHSCTHSLTCYFPVGLPRSSSSSSSSLLLLLLSLIDVVILLSTTNSQCLWKQQYFVCVSRLSVFHVSLCVSVHVFVCIWSFRHLIFVSVCAPLLQPCWLIM